MPVITDWFIGEVLSFITSGPQESVGDFFDNVKRRKELKEALNRIFEVEERNQHYESLDQVMSNSRLIQDCFSVYANEMPEIDFANRMKEILKREHVSIEEASYISNVFQKIINCTRDIMLKPGSAAEQRSIFRQHLLQSTMTARLEQKLENISSPNREAQEAIYDYESFSEEVPLPSVFIRRFLVKADSENTSTNQNPLEPLSVLETDHNIVILNDAGFGKTYALRQISCDAKKSNLHPIFLSLKHTSVLSLLNKLLLDKRSHPYRFLLILDGYDESAPSQFEEITSTLLELAKCKPYIRLVISARNNFYRDHFLNGFTKYQLANITPDDVAEYLTALSIDPESFGEEVSEKKLSEMCNNAFYFTELVNLWRESKELPNCAQVMEKIIDTRLYADQQKHQFHNPDMRQNSPAIKHLLMRSAFIMQCMHRYYLTADELKSLLSEIDKKYIELQGLCHINENNQWVFEHNNFREYLAAQWLHKMSLDDILAYITYQHDRQQIKSSWLNVLSYLTTMRRNRDLQDWIATNSPHLVTLFEKDRFSKFERDQLFIDLCSKHESDETWINEYDFYASRKLAAFGASNETTGYILDKLTQNTSMRQTKNLLRLLEHFDSLYSYEEEAKFILSEMAFDPNLPQHMRMDALYVMGAFPKTFISYAEKAAKEAVSPSSSTDYRYYLCQFINSVGCLEKYFYVIINELEHGDTLHEDINISRSIFLENVLSNIHSPNAMLDVLRHYSKSPEQYDSDLFKKTFAFCCDKLKEHASDIRKEFIDVLIQILIQARKVFANHVFEKIKEVMISTQTEPDFLTSVISSNTWEVLHSFEALMCPSFAKVLIEHYEAGKLPDENVINQLIQRSPADDKSCVLLIKAVFKKTGKIIEVTPPLDYGMLQRKGYQSYFDSLFKPTAFCTLVDRLINKYGAESSVEDNRVIYSEYIYEKIELQDCYFALRIVSYGTKEKTFHHIRDYILSNWDSQRYLLACLAIEKHSTDIKLDAEQRRWLEEQTLYRIRKLDVDKLTQLYYAKRKIVSDDRLPLKMLEWLNIDIPEDLYEKLLLIPPVAWNNSDGKFSDYLLIHIPHEVIKKHVIYNIENLQLQDCVAAAHIHYCKQNAIYGIEDFVIRFLFREDSICYRHIALKYLEELYGIEMIVQEVLPRCNEPEELQSILNVIPYNFPSALLDKKLREMYQQTGDSYYQSMQIRRNDRNALELYYKDACSQSTLPDYPSSNNVPTLTEAIRQVNDVALIDLIISLLKLTCLPHFKDVSHFGLRYSCHHALLNMATSHYEEVIQHLQKERLSKNDTYRLTCVDIIAAIQNEVQIRTDIGMSFEMAVCLTTATDEN